MKKQTGRAVVGIIMGSDSDLEVMKESAAALDRFFIPHEVTVVSAHRTPDRLMRYCRGAASRGLRVLIAGAGGAAHLPGMAAALSPLPVIGVPVKSRNSLEGFDSLLSIVQMPPGIPVATVAVNGAFNAGLLAVQVLAASNPALLKKVVLYKKGLADQVMGKVKRIEREGYRSFLEKGKTGLRAG